MVDYQRSSQREPAGDRATASAVASAVERTVIGDSVTFKQVETAEDGGTSVIHLRINLANGMATLERRSPLSGRSFIRNMGKIFPRDHFTHLALTRGDAEAAYVTAMRALERHLTHSIRESHKREMKDTAMRNVASSAIYGILLRS